MDKAVGKRAIKLATSRNGRGGIKAPALTRAAKVWKDSLGMKLACAEPGSPETHGVRAGSMGVRA